MAYDKTKPAATTPLRASNPEILANYVALETAMDQDHDFTTGGTQTGKHEEITLKVQAAPSGPGASEGTLYTKDVNAKAELHFQDEDSNEIQITSGGKILSVSLDMKDEDNMASDSAIHAASQQSIKAYVDSGTVTMTNKTLTSPVLNTGVSGTAVLDEDNMASNSATQLATQQSIKAYVDNGGGFTPTSYTGGQSITFPNGLIMKRGSAAAVTGSQTITFSVAFPNECTTVVLTQYTSDTTQYNANPKVISKSATNFVLHTATAAFGDCEWLAIGY